jgi:hypothetical protein
MCLSDSIAGFGVFRHGLGLARSSHSHRLTLSISDGAERCPLHAVVRWLKGTLGHFRVHGEGLRTSGYFGLVLRLKLYAVQSQRSASAGPRFGVT